MVLVLINDCEEYVSQSLPDGSQMRLVFTHIREVRELPMSSFFGCGKPAGSVKKLRDTSAREAL
jgi:hypothetical protein